MTVLKFTEGFGLTEDGGKVAEDVCLNERLATRTGQLIMMILGVIDEDRETDEVIRVSPHISTS